VTVTAGEQLGFSVAGAATWWSSYEIHVDGRFILSATSGATPPQVTAAVSRRTHNGNPFDISVWSANNPVECRVGGPQQIVVSFDQPVARVTEPTMTCCCPAVRWMPRTAWSSTAIR
jgi:hypothetical protein